MAESPRWLAKSIGGELSWRAPARPDAGPTVEIRDRGGSSVVAAGTAATLESVETTIAEGAEEGATSIRLSTSPTLRRRGIYLLGGDEIEEVQVKSVDGPNVELQHALAYSHPTLAAFESTRISYTLSGALATPEGDHWQAIFSYAIDAVAQPPHTEEFAIALHHFTNPCSVLGMRRIEPEIMNRLAAAHDLDDIRERAFDEVCDTLTARGIPVYDYIGSTKLARACDYMALFLIAETYGQDFDKDRTRLHGRMTGQLQLFTATTPVDENRDGVISAYESSGRTSIRIRRSS